MSKNADNQKERIKSLIEKLNEGLLEREEHIAVALLSAVAGLNVFLLGPPGTAKSLLARRIKSAFADSQEPGNYFEYLMQKFSTPDELFGPVSLTALKEDRYERKTEGFLPSAHFAFLDEIWKSGPGILNTLLTLINEKLFRNGAKLEKVPLKMLIAASNETPPPGQGLEALYDRFIVRMYVPPMEETENFESFLGGGTVPDNVNCENAITIEEMGKWQKAINRVALSKETLKIIRDIRAALEEERVGDSIYVSDRRWKKATDFLKASAFLCGRNKTTLSDALLLQHCLWTTVDNREEVRKIVENAVRNSGFQTTISAQKTIEKKDNLDMEIEKELFEKEYETLEIDGEPHYRMEKFHRKDNDGEEDASNEPATVICCIPVNQTPGEIFYPVDSKGSRIEGFSFVKNADKPNEYKVTSDSYCLYQLDAEEGAWKVTDEITLSPIVKKSKGKPRIDFSDRLPEILDGEVKGVVKEFSRIIKQIEARRNKFEQQEMDSPFVSLKQQEIALEGVNTQIDEMRVQQKSCEALIDDISRARQS